MRTGFLLLVGALLAPSLDAMHFTECANPSGSFRIKKLRDNDGNPILRNSYLLFSDTLSNVDVFVARRGKRVARLGDGKLGKKSKVWTTPVEVRRKPAAGETRGKLVLKDYVICRLEITPDTKK